MESLNNPDYSKAIEVVSEIKLGDSDHVSTENQFVKKKMNLICFGLTLTHHNLCWVEVEHRVCSVKAETGAH